MSDLVETLRQWSRDYSTDEDREIFARAAAEIKRLRLELFAQPLYSRRQLEAEIARLREQLASAAWQPIETAPRDGSRIWVFVREYDPQEYVVSWATTVDLPKDHEDYWEGWVFADEILINHCSEDIDPSHWMPLPAAPLTDDHGGT